MSSEAVGGRPSLRPPCTRRCRRRNIPRQRRIATSEPGWWGNWININRRTNSTAPAMTYTTSCARRCPISPRSSFCSRTLSRSHPRREIRFSTMPSDNSARRFRQHRPGKETRKSIGSNTGMSRQQPRCQPLGSSCRWEQPGAEEGWLRHECIYWSVTVE